MKRGEVVLVAVPYVGAAGFKVRPAVVLQNDLLNNSIQETIIAAVTSNLANSHQPYRFLIDVSTPAGKATGLLMDSVVRGERLHTVAQSDIRKVIVTLPPTLVSRLNDCLRSALGIS